MENVKELVQKIKVGLTQVSSSQKDEVNVMKAMLNDRGYEVDLYDKDGKTGSYNPCKSVREMISGVVAYTVKISNDEASELVEAYDFRKADAETLVDLSKEFINTYLKTGRKLPIGGREKSNASFILKEIKATERRYPKKIGVNSDGTDRYENGVVKVAAYEAIKSNTPCPSWVKK